MSKRYIIIMNNPPREREETAHAGETPPDDLDVKTAGFVLISPNWWCLFMP